MQCDKCGHILNEDGFEIYPKRPAYSNMCVWDVGCFATANRSGLCNRHYRVWQRRKRIWQKVKDFFTRKKPELIAYVPKEQYEIGSWK